MIDQIIENRFIAALTKNFPRAPYQLNGLQESDAELIQLPEQPDRLLAVTIDTVAEEIACGLYSDPFLIGWMAVMVNLSDLAAVGARPLGLVLSMTLEETSTEDYRSRLTEGIQHACAQAGTFILGGDTNFGEQTALTGCAIGMVAKSLAKTRLGCKAGDQLFASGPLGDGSAFALAHFTNLPPEIESQIRFQPRARIEEGAIMAQFASACIDSSDGLIAAVDQLMRLNAVGFSINCDWPNILTPTAVHLCQITGTPPWLMLAGYHGEFELIFTVPKFKVETFLQAAHRAQWQPVHLGQVLPEPEIKLQTEGRSVSIDSTQIRNLLAEVGGNVHQYIQGLRNLGKAYGLDEPLKTK